MVVVLCGIDTLVCAQGQTGVFVPHVVATTHGVLVAQSGSLAMYDLTATKIVWSSDGVQTPTRIATSKDQAAVIDAIHNAVRIVDLGSGHGTTVQTGETPIDAAFIDNQAYVLERDARALERVGVDGARASINLAADPAFLRLASGRIYVYGRASGVLQEITTTPFAIARTTTVAPFASDFEIDNGVAYLVYPRAAKIAAISIATMKPIRQINVGAVPVDVAITSDTLAIADPAAKRVWMVEGEESFGQAFARGFLRGLIGLGLTSGNRDFPTGVDRVVVSNRGLFAYDSSTGTLYRGTKPIAQNVAPQAFSIGAGGVYVWSDTVRRLQRIEAE